MHRAAINSPATEIFAAESDDHHQDCVLDHCAAVLVTLDLLSRASGANESDVACKALLTAEQQHRSALLDRHLQQNHESQTILVSVCVKIVRRYASGFIAALFPNFSFTEKSLMLCLGSIH